MPLSTYAELQAHIAGDLIRNDLATEIQDFIRLAEAHMSNRLMTREMDVSAPLTITSGVAPIPPALKSVRSIQLTAYPFHRLNPEGLNVIETRWPLAQGAPEVYAMTAEQFLFWPATSAAAKIVYRRDVPALSAANPVNWVLAEHPHLYVYGALYFAHLFLKDDARAAQYQTLFSAAIDELNQRDIVSQVSGATMRQHYTVV